MADTSNFTRLDRDLLIRVDTKVDAMADQIKDLADGTQMRLSKVETKHETDNAKVVARLDAMDVYHAKIDLVRFEALATWVSNVKANVALLFTIWTLLGGVITALVLWAIQSWLKIKL